MQVKLPDLGGLHDAIDAVLHCRARGMGCCLGGSANETDVSARVTAQVALATQPDFLLSKPGIGVDEGVMILTNEMLRTLALVDGFDGVVKRNGDGVNGAADHQTKSSQRPCIQSSLRRFSLIIFS